MQWMEQQKENLIILTIEQAEKPTIKMVTEAGLIGKIGMWLEKDRTLYLVLSLGQA